VSSPKFALVSTVDTGDLKFFDRYKVFLFETETEAIDTAVAILITAGEVTIDKNGGYRLAGERYLSAEEALDAWQDHLDATEYFHVMPVADLSEMAGARS
jgi:hypothetical protein